MTKIFITGASGSCGSYLCEYLSRNPNMEVYGTIRRNRQHLRPEGYNLCEIELTVFNEIYFSLKYHKPDIIFNLAANADVRGSFDRPIEVLNNNIFSTANLLEAVALLKKQEGYDPIIQHCSTSEVYGIITEKDGPVDENYPLKPVNVYAVSKLTQEQLALAYHKMYGLRVIVTRAFGYINPRRNNIFSTAFARQLVEIERGKRQTLEHGNLDSVRTLMDVRDICRAYWYAATQGEVGEVYNIGSTQPISVKDFLTLLVRKSNMKDKAMRFKTNEDLLRPVDVTLQIPNTKKFLARTGFYCDHTLDESIKWLLEECRG
jgi:GDP-4-dehydro-6-deoxy-D-mannose reductase